MKSIYGIIPINGTIPIILVITIFGLLSTQASAASFDCKKAASWVEKTVCSNPEISKLDEQMAKAYHDALASLSPEGQKETKEYQRQWLKGLTSMKAGYDKYYSELKVNSSYRDFEINTNLQTAYEERIKQLQESLIKFSDRIFRNIYIYHSKTERNCEEESTKKVGTGKYLSYPQIVKPYDENEKFWNSLILKKVKDQFKIDENLECTNTEDEYIVSFSNKHLISLQIKRRWDEYGAQHAPLNSTSFSWLLEQRRELQTADIFDDKTDWRKKIEDLIVKKIKEKETDDVDVKKEDYKIYLSQIKEAETSPEKWKMSRGRLDFGLNYARGNSSFFIEINWKDLDPYLSKNGRSLIYD